MIVINNNFYCYLIYKLFLPNGYKYNNKNLFNIKKHTTLWNTIIYDIYYNNINICNLKEKEFKLLLLKYRKEKLKKIIYEN